MLQNKNSYVNSKSYSFYNIPTACRNRQGVRLHTDSFSVDPLRMGSGCHSSIGNTK